MAKIRIGPSGWDYDNWKGDFYPEDLPRTRRLRYVAGRFDTLEVNGSFYSLLRASTYRDWYQETPRDFRFAVKGSRFITHSKKLADVRLAVANFMASGILALDQKLGPILWQLPARHVFDRDRLDSFLQLLPRTTEEAFVLADGHDERVPEPFVGKDEGRSNHLIRHVLEPRNESFFSPEAVGILRDAGVALAVSHAGDWQRREELTAGFAYVRLHGAPETYHSGYGDEELDGWAGKIRCWAVGEEPEDAARITERAAPSRKGRDVYVYFDNDAEGHAPYDALNLKERLQRGEAAPSKGEET
ncbi:MAG: DUF72 domain-containing protein [Longimicrobiales bacterium]|nr:DUF72 domain-containing protein [Longimicrobiales bacterium]